eukprot:3979998-Lingulodinium_polyedra.AAC.1
MQDGEQRRVRPWRGRNRHQPARQLREDDRGPVQGLPEERDLVEVDDAAAASSRGRGRRSNARPH